MISEPAGAIKVGTMVKITTDNGGEIVARLLQTYRPTYDAIIAVGETGYAIIICWRLKTIEAQHATDSA